MQILSPSEFVASYCEHYRRLPMQKHRPKDPKRRKGNAVYYKDIVTAFDIETTRLDNDQSVMYVWQMQYGLECTVIGRTWEEFLLVIDMLSNPLCEGEYCVMYVHNLSYEFQFLAGIYEFAPDDIFAIKSRKVLKCRMKNVELRCSYLHSNMSLAMYLDKMQAEHRKLSGDDYNYHVKRYPDTDLTSEEIEYCQNDVLGLVEALTNEMSIDDDNLYSIPLTSTGYVRRDVKLAMRSTPKNYVKDMLPDFNLYVILREAFRGGNTHANRYYVGMILDNVKSADRSSSYPDVQINCKFPVSKFKKEQMTPQKAVRMIRNGKRAFVTRVALEGNIRLRYEWWGCPYLAKDKCRFVENGAFDNGRVLTAEYLETTVTDIDLAIILSEYDFDKIEIFDSYTARYGELPPVYKEVIKDYYTRKTELKGVDGQEVQYTKAKNKLNSIYGMTAQDPVKQSIDFIDGIFMEENSDPEELLLDHNERAFLPYQWGVWTTALARLRLEEGIRLAGENFVYADTDSVKYLGDIDWTAYNAGRIADSEANDATATDPKGERHYMGVYEQEEEYRTFVTLGAKKYAYTYTDGKARVTVAGVNKRRGGAELDQHGGLTAFRDGFIFSAAGGNELLYNDNPAETEYSSDKGNKYPITRNVTIRPSTYQLGLTMEYVQLLQQLNIKAKDLWR